MSSLDIRDIVVYSLLVCMFCLDSMTQIYCHPQSALSPRFCRSLKIYSLETRSGSRQCGTPGILSLVRSCTKWWRDTEVWDDTVRYSSNLTLRKIAIWMSKNCQKLDIFFKKIYKNFHFFQQNCQWQFFWKNKKFGHFFFLKKYQVFVNFLTVKWQFSGGSG